MTSTSPTGRIVSFGVRIAVVLLLLAGSAGILFWLTNSRIVPPSSEQSLDSRPVEVIRATLRPVARVWLGYGVARSRDSADIPSEVSSIVREIPEDVEVGQVVQAGQLLVRLDATDFEQQLEIAARTLSELGTRVEKLALDLETARELVGLREEEVAILVEDLARLEAARADAAATQREVDIVRQRLIQSRSAAVAAREQLDSIPIARRLLETQIAAQEFTRELARRNVERCRITSPIDGILESIDVEVGERVDPLGRVGRVVDPRRLEIPVRLPSSARASVRIGNRVDMRAGGSVPRNWTAELTRISPVDDGATRTMTVFVELDQSVDVDGDLMAPGTFVAARVTSSESRARLVVPRESVRNERLWYIDPEGRVASMRVEVDFPLESSGESARQLVIDAPLPDDTLILIDGGKAPSPGTLVQPSILERPDQASPGRQP